MLRCVPKTVLSVCTRACRPSATDRAVPWGVKLSRTPGAAPELAPFARGSGGLDFLTRVEQPESLLAPGPVQSWSTLRCERPGRVLTLMTRFLYKRKSATVGFVCVASFAACAAGQPARAQTCHGPHAQVGHGPCLQVPPRLHAFSCRPPLECILARCGISTILAPTVSGPRQSRDCGLRTFYDTAAQLNRTKPKPQPREHMNASQDDASKSGRPKTRGQCPTACCVPHSTRACALQRMTPAPPGPPACAPLRIRHGKSPSRGLSRR